LSSEFVNRQASNALSYLQKREGLIEVRFLTNEMQNEHVSLTIWRSKEDAKPEEIVLPPEWIQPQIREYELFYPTDVSSKS
jgi:hypothetical protein